MRDLKTPAPIPEQGLFYARIITRSTIRGEIDQELRFAKFPHKCGFDVLSINCVQIPNE